MHLSLKWLDSTLTSSLLQTTSMIIFFFSFTPLTVFLIFVSFCVRLSDKIKGWRFIWDASLMRDRKTT